nr:MAG TPA: hypothetical protein [Caudoviricetes sp.]
MQLLKLAILKSTLRNSHTSYWKIWESRLISKNA